MAITSDHWSELVDPVMNRAFWFLGYTQENRRASMIPTLYNMQTSQYATEKALAINGLADEGWNFEDTGRVQYTEPIKGYEKTFTHREFARGVTVTRKMLDDNQVAEFANLASALGDAAFRFREKAAANVFQNANFFSAATSETLDDYGTDAVGPDSVALGSAAHPNHALDSSSTQSNEGTSSLTAANVSTTRQLMAAFTDMSGDIIDVMPDELLVPPELEDTALEIVRSAQDPDSANNAINPQAGRFTVRVWHYLTDANNWFMMDSGYRRRSLVWYDRVPLEFARESDFDTLMAKWRAYQRFSLGWTDWRWVYGHQVS
jgi:hypothetical protein